MKRVKPLNEHLKILLYGQPGSGKTRTAATANLDPRTGPVLHVDCAGNPVSIRDYSPLPDILRVDKMSDLNLIYDFLQKGQKPEHTIVKEYGLKPPYKTLVFDGVTELQRYSFAAVTGQATRGPGDIPTAYQRQHFGSVLSQMTNFARLFFSLPMHVIITALEKEERDEGTGSFYYRPLLLGQSAGEIAGYAFIVARMVHRARLDVRTLREMGDAINAPTAVVALFQPAGRYYAKDQTGALPPYIIGPTVGEVYNRVFGAEPETKEH